MGGRMLDLPRHPGFARRFALVQRAGWVLMAGFVLAAIAGMTGAGGIWAHGQLGLAEWPLVMRARAADGVQMAGGAQIDPALGRAFTIEQRMASSAPDGRPVLRLMIRPIGAGLARVWLDTGIAPPRDRVQAAIVILP